MKHLRKITKIALLSMFGLLLATCQKENSLIVNQFTSDASSKAEISSPQLKSASLPPDYLQDLINSINSMVANETLSKGEGQSLIAKAENAIKSIEKGNTNAVDGQLGAFNTEVEYFVDNGTLTSEQGESLTNVADFVVEFPDGSFTDSRDGYIYPVVLIGDQVWMAENLRATKYQNNDQIPNITEASSWAGLTTGAYCDYINIATANTYGKLYNYYAVVDNRNLCPTGWHVPSDAEWTTLTNYLGGESVAGGKLKETGTSHWLSPNTGTNSTGFTALPGGFRNYIGEFYRIGYRGYWWSSTEYESSATFAWPRTMYNDLSNVYRNLSSKQFGFSVRCIKD